MAIDARKKAPEIMGIAVRAEMDAAAIYRGLHGRVKNEVLKQKLDFLAKGYLYKEIGDQLSITLSTVRAHLHTIYEKLHVQSRTQAVVKFLGRE